MYPTDLKRPHTTLLLLQPAFERPAVPLCPFPFSVHKLPTSGSALPFRGLLPRPIDLLAKDAMIFHDHVSNDGNPHGPGQDEDHECAADVARGSAIYSHDRSFIYTPLPRHRAYRPP